MMKDKTKESVMIEIAITQKAKAELLKVLGLAGARSVRLVQQGFG